MSNNIVWVQGKQGSGKTTLKRFLASTYGELVIYDINVSGGIVAASLAIESVLTQKDNYPKKMIIFSQEAPPEKINGLDFKPLHYIISQPNKNGNNDI